MWSFFSIQWIIHTSLIYEIRLNEYFFFQQKRDWSWLNPDSIQYLCPWELFPRDIIPDWGYAQNHQLQWTSRDYLNTTINKLLWTSTFCKNGLSYWNRATFDGSTDWIESRIFVCDNVLFYPDFSRYNFVFLLSSFSQSILHNSWVND